LLSIIQLQTSIHDLNSQNSPPLTSMSPLICKCHLLITSSRQLLIWVAQLLAPCYNTYLQVRLTLPLTSHTLPCTAHTPWWLLWETAFRTPITSECCPATNRVLSNIIFPFHQSSLAPLLSLPRPHLEYHDFWVKVWHLVSLQIC
jgi:hypothetical protein